MKRTIIETILVAILYIITGLAFVRIVTGCRTVEKTITKTEYRTDSTHVRENDSLRIVNHDLVMSYEEQIRQYRDAGVIFDSTPCPDIPNTIEISTDGTIKASGSIKSANLNSKTDNKKVERLQQTIDSLTRVKNKESVTVKTEYKNVTRDVKKKFPWFWLVVAFISGAILWHNRQWFVKGWKIVRGFIKLKFGI